MVSPIFRTLSFFVPRLFPLISIFSAACTSMTSAQTGRTVPAGQLQFYFGLTAMPHPALEGDVRFGLTNSLEVGAGAAVPGNFRLRIKSNLWDTQSFSIATGVEGSYLHVASEAPESPGQYFSTSEIRMRKRTPLVPLNSIEGSGTSTSSVFRNLILSIPVYIGIHFSEAFALTLTPRFGWSYASYVGPEEAVRIRVDERSSVFYGGGEVGAVMGTKWGMTIGAGLYNGLPGYQASVGLFFKPSEDEDAEHRIEEGPQLRAEP